MEALRARSLDRHLRGVSSAQGPVIEIAGRFLVNFSSNDYLGLANDARLRDAATAAINFLASSEGEARRLLLWERIRLMQQLLPKARLKAEDVVADSAIFPLIVGDEKAALDLAAALRSEGFLVIAIRYPTVAKGAARLRITVTAAHEDGQNPTAVGRDQATNALQLFKRER